MKLGHRTVDPTFSSTIDSHVTRTRIRLIASIFVIHFLVLAGGCGVINPGKWKGIEKTATDEHHWLVKDVYLTAGSSYLTKEHFDHRMNDVVNLFFTPANEKNHYVAKTMWFDPNGIEYRTIRTTYDLQQEGKTEVSPRKKGGTPRVHSMPTKELFQHKPGLWKVALYIDDELARRLTFSIR